MGSATSPLSQPMALVIAIQSGDKQAESELVRTYWRGVKFIVLKQCGEPHLAEDITQDALIVVIQKIRQRQLNDPDALSSYIRQTALNLLIAHRRKEVRRQTDINNDIVINEADKTQSLVDFVDANQILEKVKALLLELPTERDRELLRRYFILDQDKQQIAQALQLNADQFDKVLYRAKDRLKKKILSSKDSDAYQQHVQKLVMVLICYSCATSHNMVAEQPLNLVLAVNKQINLREKVTSWHLNTNRRLVTLVSQQSKRFSSMAGIG